MAIFRVQVTLPFRSGIPSDVATNTFHWNVDPPASQAQLDLILNVVQEFYTSPTVAPSGMPAVFSNVISRAVPTCRIAITRLSDPVPRPVVAERFFAMPIVPNPPVANIINHPNEVSVVLSSFAAPEAGVPAGRLRNRVYLGPLTLYGQSQVVTEPTRVGVTQATIILDAAERMAEQGPVLGVRWVVYSATAAALGLASFRPIQRLRVNDEYDSQRRRQPRPSVAYTRFPT